MNGQVETLRKNLVDAIVECDLDKTVSNVEAARGVITPQEIIDALSEGMHEVGIRFERGKLFLPHVMVAANAMTSGVALIEGDLAATMSGGNRGHVVMGTVEGDVHDIGKSIVSTMLQCAGYEVNDVGRDVPTATFLDAVKEGNADVLGLSALMTTSMQTQKEVIETLIEKGMRKDVMVIIGGAPVTQAYADKIGADGYSENASEAVKLVHKLMGI